MLETMATFVLAEHLGGLTFDPPAGDVGYARILAGGRRPAPTRDGFVTLLPYTGAHWTSLFEYNKREDLKQKYDVFNPHERNSRIRELYADLHQITRQMTSAECLEMCRKLDLPASPIYALQDLPEHPHLKAVGLFQKGEHPTEGQIVSMRSPTRFFGTPAELALPAPTLGQQTEEILRESGLKEAEIAALVQRGIVRSATVKSSVVQGKEESTA
jgi:formyl-CoA transferase